MASVVLVQERWIFGLEGVDYKGVCTLVTELIDMFSNWICFGKSSGFKIISYISEQYSLTRNKKYKQSPKRGEKDKSEM